jgi:hypothetical protein
VSFKLQHQFHISNDPVVLPASDGVKNIIKNPVAPLDCNTENAKRALGAGLNGNIQPSDYAYGTVAEAQRALWHSRMSTKFGDGRFEFPADVEKKENAFMLAEKQDPNECVVIDFRDFTWNDK